MWVPRYTRRTDPRSPPPWAAHLLCAIPPQECFSAHNQRHAGRGVLRMPPHRNRGSAGVRNPHMRCEGTSRAKKPVTQNTGGEPGARDDSPSPTHKQVYHKGRVPGRQVPREPIDSVLPTW